MVAQPLFQLRIPSMVSRPPSDIPNGLTPVSFQSQMPVILPLFGSTWMLFSRRSVWLGTSGQSLAKRPGSRLVRLSRVGRNRLGSPCESCESCDE